MAVPYVTLDDCLANLQYQIEATPALIAVSALIEAYRLANVTFLMTETTLDERNDILKKITGCTSVLSSALNCYPRGAVTTLCFDADGNPIP